MKKKQQPEIFWNGETPVKPFTLKELKRPPNTGSIKVGHCKLFSRKLDAIQFTVLNCRGIRTPFAHVYRHPCGEVMVCTTRVGSISLKTLLGWIVPAMEEFKHWLPTVKNAARALAERK